MEITFLPVFTCAILILWILPLLRTRISPRLILLVFSLICMVWISLWGATVLVAFSLIVYAGAIVVQRERNVHLFRLIVALCLLPLISYKIFDARTSIESDGVAILEIVGISYFSFNGLAYLFDVRKGFQVPEKNYTHLLLFLSFFPCITAGPIHRYKYLDAQFSATHQSNADDLSRGFRLVLWGLFKNLVLAQRCKAIADVILDHPGDYQGIFVLLGGLAFFLQLYSDFTGYVDVGMGLSRMLGIQISENFNNRVYLSSSRSEFWAGWHKTVNAWFRDYLFFPLVKGRASQVRIDFALVLTFILIGLWHELSAKFFIWGLLNGLWILVESKIRRRFSFSGPVWRMVGVVYHLSLASFMAVIFRTTDLFASFHALIAPARESFEHDNLLRTIFFTIPLLLAADQVNRLIKNDTIDVAMSRLKGWQRWSFYFGLAFLIMAFGQLAIDGHYYARF